MRPATPGALRQTSLSSAIFLVVLSVMFCSFRGLWGAAAAAPLPRGERGVTNGKPLRGEPKRIFLCAFSAQEKLSFWAEGLVVREGSALSDWRGSAKQDSAAPLFGAERELH